MADGSAYVTVQANESSPKARSVGSGGGTVYGSYKLDWTFSGGFSGYMGWTLAPTSPNPNLTLDPITVTPVEENVEATNSAISSALSGKNMLYVQSVINGGCATNI